MAAEPQLESQKLSWRTWATMHDRDFSQEGQKGRSARILGFRAAASGSGAALRAEGAANNQTF